MVGDMKRNVFCILAVMLSLGIPARAKEPTAPKNFIVIFADDLGYGDMGCYRELFKGGDDRTISHNYTPTIDKLGRDGVRSIPIPDFIADKLPEER